ncbi:heat-inducible transcriptional repressor HrcA, partial [candidate division WWE3 bacterium]|nr:heat-inducible transcriptional repressor HrcA [candidate division WWE3 bacterium]
MFEDLSERQISLINAIIKEYLATSEPVGSNVIVKKYSLRCSPATVRNEMARLLEDGYLDMLHTSSGRVPTPQAYRLFLNEIMEEHDIPVLQEVAIKQRLWPSRFELSRLLRQSTIALADYSQLLAVATTDDG